MTWYSYPFGAALTPQQAAQPVQPRELLGTLPPEAPHVFGASRRGALLQTVRELLVTSGAGADGLYLLQDQALLTGADVVRQGLQIETLLAAIGDDPGLVVAATRAAYTPTTTVHGEGFEPLPCELVYPPDCRIEDGWVYFYSEDQVRALLAAAVCGPDPKPAADDEGESLEYVFGFLKSHAALLRSAAQAGLCVAYAEMNPPQ